MRTVLADRLTRQPLGFRSWTQVWNRQLRWRLIWRVQAPAVYGAALLGSAFPAALAGAIAAPTIGCPPAMIAAATLGAWFGLETILCLARRWPVSVWAPIAFIGREILDMAVWLRALTTSEVAWAGGVYRAGKAMPVASIGTKLTPALGGDGTHDA
jgi:ceramide glucosyltransferase